MVLNVPLGFHNVKDEDIAIFDFLISGKKENVSIIKSKESGFRIVTILNLKFTRHGQAGKCSVNVWISLQKVYDVIMGCNNLQGYALFTIVCDLEHIIPV